MQKTPDVIMQKREARITDTTGKFTFKLQNYMWNSSDYGYDDYRDYHPDQGLEVRLA